jgi:hypothetical protein
LPASVTVKSLQCRATPHHIQRRRGPEFPAVVRLRVDAHDHRVPDTEAAVAARPRQAVIERIADEPVAGVPVPA